MLPQELAQPEARQVRPAGHSSRHFHGTGGHNSRCGRFIVTTDHGKGVSYLYRRHLWLTIILHKTGDRIPIGGRIAKEKIWALAIRRTSAFRAVGSGFPFGLVQQSRDQ